MTIKEKMIALMELGVSVSKISSPIHKTTISKWMNGERELTEKNKKIIEEKLQAFKEEVNKIL